jgi:hypothetical protein
VLTTHLLADDVDRAESALTEEQTGGRRLPHPASVLRLSIAR